MKKLLLIALPPFIVLAIFSPQLFALLFGEKWRIAGEYAQLMCPMFFFRFITNPLSVVTIIAQKNRCELYWQGCLLLLLAGLALFQHMVPISAKQFILLFTAIYCLLDVIYLFVNHRFACERRLPASP